MSESTNTILQRAYELIESDELEQAQELLAPLLETEEKNPSLWWVYSHSLRDQSIGQLALDRVLALDPSYPGANELKEDLLDVQSRDPDFLEAEADGIVSAQGIVDSIDDWDDLQTGSEDSEETSDGRRVVILLAAILFVVAAGITLVASGAIDISEILSGILPTPEAEIIVVAGPTVDPAASESGAGEPAPESTPAATALASAAATDDPAVVLTVAGTADPTPDEASSALSAFVGAVAESISDFEIDHGASATRDTSLGRTIVVQVCAVPGREFNTRLSQVINAMVDLADELPDETDAVAAGLLNCDDESANLRIIGVSVEIVRQFQNQDIDAKEFQRAWQPLS